MEFIIIYLAVVAAGLCIAYFAVRWTFSQFFDGAVSLKNQSLYRSLLIIAFSSIAASFISYTIVDKELNNRVLHFLGGGCTAFLLCFLAVKDSKIKITKFQFFVFSALLVTAMGVGNELIEFYIQSHYDVISAQSVFDTWRDLASNTLGIFVAGALLVPFL